MDDRQALDALFYVLREGCRWRALPEYFGHWMTMFMRCKRWVESELWKALMRLQRTKALEAKIAFMDGMMVRTRRHKCRDCLR